MLHGIDALIHSTIRIECLSQSGARSSGTGFVLMLFEKEALGVPVLVTNKHVVAGAAVGFLHLTLAGEDESPQFGAHERVEISDFGQRWFGHPSSDVDLAIFLIGPLLNEMREQARNAFVQIIPTSIVATNSLLENLTAMEEIIMIGYPNGIWDSTNNIPIIRRGVTATPPSLNYEGKREFMIDCACFPGSSGSPVFLYNDGAYSTKDGSQIMGGLRVFLLGVLYAGPQHTARGELIIASIPTDTRHIPISRIPNNLGLVIKGERLREFETALVDAGFQVPADLITS